MKNSKDLAVGHRAAKPRKTPTTNIQKSKVLKGAWIILGVFGATFATCAQSNPPSTNAAPYLVPPYGEMQPTFWELHGTLIIAATSALVLAVIAAVCLLLRPRKVAPPRLAFVARKELAKLGNRPEDGACLSAVSQVLRRYFTAAFHLGDGELNTAEFCAAMTAKPEIGADLIQPVADFLHQCDERKFSKAGGVEPLNAVHKAEDFLARAEVRSAAKQSPPA